jgi:hypothetical protein
MISIGWVVVMVVVVGVLCLTAVMMGAFLMFRGQKGGAVGFFKEPKGAVFSIPEADLDIPEVDLDIAGGEDRILKNTERFMSILGGKNAG